jgi:quercetin dioxygenase-like cupin family protein
MSDHPRTIDNGAGEKLTFVSVGADERGEYMEARNSVSPGSGPPMHVHHPQEESLTVERGTMGWRRQGEEEHLAQRGETVTFAPGDVHRFWNAGEDELVCTGYVHPPDNLEYFLTQIFASARGNGGKRPRLFDAAYLTSRYRSEFGMAAIPAPVERLPSR